MGDRISPSHTGYAPEPSQSTPDRDPDGRYVRKPRRSQKSKKKRKEEKSPKPADPSSSQVEQEEQEERDEHVDIRAFQIETQRASYAAASSTPPACE